VTPYTNMNQIVSGALTFAVASGCAVVSTPYLYAVDMARQGAGVILAERSVASFSAAILELNDPTYRTIAQRRSQSIGVEMQWGAIGRRMALLASNAVGTKSESPRRSQLANGVLSLVEPEEWQPTPTRPISVPRYVRSRHLRRLVDDRGIIQHATGVVPLLSSGYCIDDIARLVIVSSSLSDGAGTEEGSDYWEAVFTRSIAVIADSHLPGSSMMKNFFDWSGRWLDEPYFGDHVGRALLGLSSAPFVAEYSTVIAPLFADVLDNWPDDSPIHPIVYALLAQAKAPHLARLDIADRMLQQLLVRFHASSGPHWKWLETSVRYDQGRFPQALILGGWMLGNPEAIECGLEALNWWTAQCDQGNYLRFPGHHGWSNTYPLAWSGDEQPLEALSFVEAHYAAFEVTGELRYAQASQLGLQWFFGANRLAISLASEHSGACHDGLGSFDVNANCGAESTLAMMQAHLHYERILAALHPALGPSVLRVSAELPRLTPQLTGI
jgi:hypothetical protein